MISKITTLLITLCFLGYVNAQDIPKTDIESGNVISDVTSNNAHTTQNLKFFFKINQYDFEADFSTNTEQLRILQNIMAHENSLVGLDSLHIIAAASLDGDLAENDILAANRARVVKELLLSKYPKIKPELVHSKSIAEEWIGFRKMIERDDNLPFKTEVIKVVDGVGLPDEKERVLKTMKNGKVWDYLKVHILPKCRYGASLVFYYNVNRDETIREPKKPKEVIYQQDTIVTIDTLRFVDTVRVDMSLRKFKKTYEVVSDTLH